MKFISFLAAVWGQAAVPPEGRGEFGEELSMSFLAAECGESTMRFGAGVYYVSVFRKLLPMALSV